MSARRKAPNRRLPAVRSETGDKLARRTALAKRQSKEGLLDYLGRSGDAGLHNARLERLNRVSNLRKAIIGLLDELTDTIGEEKAIEMLPAHRRAK